MRTAPVALVLANGALALAIIATYGTSLGRARWHDEAAYVALSLAAIALLPLWRRRRVVTLALASAGAWSLATGLLLVYIAPWLPGGRWMTWWHAATSAAFLLAFLAHWLRNHPRLLGLAAKLARRRAALLVTIAAWALLAGAAAWTLAARAAFTETVAWRAADRALLAASVAAIVGAAWAARLAPRVEARHVARGATDATLWGAMVLATVTGAALAYAARALRAADAYWWTIGWHLFVSYALLAAVAWHVAFNARPLAAHAR